MPSLQLLHRARRPPSPADLLLPLPVLEFEQPTVALMATPVRPAARSMLWVVVSLVALCGTAAVVVPIDTVVTTPARIVASQPTVVVQPLETAIVRGINVREGEVVRAGQVLARLDPTFSAADVGALTAQVRSFQTEVDRLTAEAADLPYGPSTSDPAAAVQAALHGERQAQYRSQMESYAQRIYGLNEQVTRAKSDIKAFMERREIAADVETRYRLLERQHAGNAVDRLSAQDRRVEIERNLSDATGAVERASRELAQTIAERDGFAQQWKAEVNQDLHERRRSLSDALESLSKATLRNQLVELRAEQDAVVLTVARVSVGSVMRSGDQFITLVPTSAPLEIEARVPGADAAHVQAGQKVVIKFDAFPYVQYGSGAGTVQNLSADSFVGPEEAPLTAVVNKVPPYYKARIAIDDVQMHDVPGGFKLKPGMPVTADIKIGRRNLAHYLFGRVLSVGLEGMREP